MVVQICYAINILCGSLEIISMLVDYDWCSLILVIPA